MKYIKIAFACLLVAIFGWVMSRMYLYRFYSNVPDVSIVGLDNDQYYAGDIVGSLKGKSPYNVAHISMWLDDKLMHSEFKINKKQFDFPIELPVQNISDGKHHLKFEITDGTKNQNKAIIERSFYTDNVGLQAAFVSSCSNCKVSQGRCLRVQFQVNKPIKSATVKALGESYNCFPENKNSLIYEAYIPTSCEQVAQEYPLSVEINDFVGSKFSLENKFQVSSFPFKRKVLHVASDKMKKEEEFTQLGEIELEGQLEKLAQQSAKEKLWSGAFDVPITMTGMSTEFGVIRTTQQRGRYAHKAVDIVGEPKSVVWAAGAGKVVLKDRFVHSGNTVVIDHGQGVLSMYFHLHDLSDIQVGQMIKKGKPVGTIGMTGFANGYHLHWEIRVNNVPIDPMQWTQASF